MKQAKNRLVQGVRNSIQCVFVCFILGYSYEAPGTAASIYSKGHLFIYLFIYLFISFFVLLAVAADAAADDPAVLQAPEPTL